MSKKYDYSKLLKVSRNLDQRRKNMEDTKKVLEEIELRYWLYEGALLGIYRDGDFIPWDWDLDFLVISKEVVSKIGPLKKKLSKLGFEVNVNVQKKKRPKIGFSRKGEKTSINGYFISKDKTLCVRKPYQFPMRLFESGGSIEYKGIQYPCPDPIEEYLELAYGDWKTPVKSGNPNDYRRGRGDRSDEVEVNYQKTKQEGKY